MSFRVLLIICCAAVYVSSFAQSSGGQITRPNYRSTHSPSHNMHTKPTPAHTSRSITKVSEPDNYVNGHGYVDLGLPSGTKWATCNVGANSPEVYGSYFAWGETSAKTDYGSITQNSIRKDIGVNISGSSYDAAHTNLGGNWRMPTKIEVQELIDNCKWKQARYKGTDGFCVTGPNNKSIFIPAAGYYSEKERQPGYFIKLWTATAELDDQYSLCWVYHLHLDKNIYQTPPVQPHLIRESYYVGMCIRPVIN